MNKPPRKSKTKAAKYVNPSPAAMGLATLLAGMLQGVECHENRLGNNASARAKRPGVSK